MFAFVALITGFSAWAQLDDSQPRGQQTWTFTSPSNVQEHCYATKSFPGFTMSENQRAKDFKDESRLCQIDFYQAGALNTAVCPKLSSTNPGVEVFEMEGEDKFDTFQNTQCALKDGPDRDKIAKFKSSVSCSNTSSIIGYYHLSRIIDTNSKVPVSVIRTMDLTFHLKLRDLALELLGKFGKAGDLIFATWKGSWGAAYN
ncbi:MAG: hypothetical protein KDD25_05800, partial [Bdellovibrionales bacterium]|nr:hypothetical protein [Bdellovibrionales bacterium]